LRESVLLRGTLLQEHFPFGIVDKDVNRTMTQAASMHFFARELADNLVALVYDVE